MDADRVDPLEMVFAEIGDLERRLDQVACEPLHRDVGQQDLVGICGILQSRRRRQRRTEIVALAACPRQPGVDAEPDLEPSGRAPISVAHGALCLDRRHHRIERVVEDREHAVAGRSEGISAMAADCSMQNAVMLVHRVQHVVWVAAQERGAAHDVGGEDRLFAAVCRQFRDVGRHHGRLLDHARSPERSGIWKWADRHAERSP